jgi:hypothetical protein
MAIEARPALRPGGTIERQVTDDGLLGHSRWPVLSVGSPDGLAPRWRTVLRLCDGRTPNLLGDRNCRQPLRRTVPALVKSERDWLIKLQAAPITVVVVVIAALGSSEPVEVSGYSETSLSACTVQHYSAAPSTAPFPGWDIWGVEQATLVPWRRDTGTQTEPVIRRHRIPGGIASGYRAVGERSG